jgi:hypothetical protein
MDNCGLCMSFYFDAINNVGYLRFTLEGYEEFLSDEYLLEHGFI